MEDRLFDAKRIVLYGCTGSGKTTAAKAIGGLTGLPVVDEDALIWRPGWEAVPHDEQVAVFTQIAGQPEWVIDGDGPGGMMFAEADLLLLLDYPRWLSFQRLLRRSVARVVRQTSVCNGNHETWGALLGSDSILRWHVRTWKKKRRMMRKLAAENPERALLLSNPAELALWIGSLATDRESRSALPAGPGNDGRQAVT